MAIRAVGNVGEWQAVGEWRRMGHMAVVSHRQVNVSQKAVN